VGVCAACHDAVQAGDWPTIQARHLALWWATQPMTLGDEAAARAAVGADLNAFQAARIGAPTPISGS
jgi:hypothetical protein